MTTEDEEKVTYEKMDFTDLFNEVAQEMQHDKAIDIASGAVQKATVLDSRLGFVKASKAKLFLNYDGVVKAGNGLYSVPKTELILLEDELDVVNNAFMRLAKETCFLRACPEHPRHGVLESLPVNNVTLEYEWSKLRATMKTEDPNGCMLMQPFIPATSSMVMAPNMYATIGPGFDGVTAGHGLQLMFLMNPTNPECTNDFAQVGAPMKNGRTLYELEYVYERAEKYLTDKYATGKATLTQIRGCPPHSMPMSSFKYEIMRNGNLIEVKSTIQGCVPETGIVKVKQVWFTEGLEGVPYLEEHITKEKCPEGFVISHPSGSLSSHVYAHARAHDIPYVIGDVEVGETWVEGSPCNVAVEEGHPIVPEPYDPYENEDLDAFRLGLSMSQTRWQRQQGWFAHFFHQWIGQNVNPKRAPILAGAFAGWEVKAALGLCLGEIRYAKSMKKDANVSLLPVISAAIGDSVWMDITGETKPTPSQQRKHYYVAMERLDLNYGEMRKALLWCEKQFNTGWKTTAYGGKNWGRCARGAADLCGAIMAFQKNPTRDNIKTVTIQMNKAENFAHNNGSLYNKFLSGHAFEQATLNNTLKWSNKQGDGNGLFSHSNDGIKEMFRTYELAQTFLIGTANEKVAPPTNDWNTIFDYALSTSDTGWRKNMICVSRNVPSPIQRAAIALGPSHLHHSNKMTLNDDFFMACGHSECTTCAEKNILILNMGHDLDFTAILLEADHPSAFFALSPQKSSIMSYSVGQLIKDKQYDQVTPEMFVEAWNGLNTQDVLYKILSEMMKKHLKKMLTTNVEYSKAVSNLIEGVDA